MESHAIPVYCSVLRNFAQSHNEILLISNGRIAIANLVAARHVVQLEDFLLHSKRDRMELSYCFLATMFLQFRIPLELLDRIIQERQDRHRKRMLEELPEARPGARTDLTSDHDDQRLSHGTKLRLRAIKERAPAIVRHLYEEELIGVEAAVSLSQTEFSNSQM